MGIGKILGIIITVIFAVIMSILVIGASAIKLFDNEQECQDFCDENGYNLEERKEEAMKCQNYCICKEFCNYYKSLKGE